MHTLSFFFFLRSGIVLLSVCGFFNVSYDTPLPWWSGCLSLLLLRCGAVHARLQIVYVCVYVYW
jgi:hypothetical protein